MPGPHAVESIARLFSDLATRALERHELKSRLFITVHELADNALRHSTDGQGRISLVLRQGGERVRVTVTTTNRTRFAERAELIARFSELDEAPDRRTFYQDLLYRARAGIGLARVYGEVAMDLSLDTNEADDVVRIRAETSVPCKTLKSRCDSVDRR